MSFPIFRNKTYIQFYLSLVLIIAIIGLSFSFIEPTLEIFANYQSQKKEIDSKISEIKNSLDSAKSSYNDVSQKKDTLEAEVQNVENDISETEKLITDTQKLVETLTTNIETNQAKIEELKGEIRSLLIEVQKQTQISPIQTILSSRSIGDALAKLYSYSSIQTRLDEAKSDLETENQKLDENKSNQEVVLTQLNDSKVLLEVKKQELDTLINEYAGKEEEYAQEIAKLKSENASLEAEAQKLQKAFEESQAAAAKKPANIPGPQNQVSGNNTGPTINFVQGTCWFEDARNPGIPAGFFQRPVNGGTVSDIFGCPTPYSSSWRAGHDGIDIAAPYGTPVLAAAPGIVHAVSSGAGYGNYVMIKHTLPSGERVYSLYGHLSGFATSTGAQVGQGQAIGYIGSTGFSTGNHVHYMLYTQSFESSGLGCRLGGSKCYNPARFQSF